MIKDNDLVLTIRNITRKISSDIHIGLIDTIMVGRSFELKHKPSGIKVIRNDISGNDRYIWNLLKVDLQDEIQDFEVLYESKRQTRIG